MRNSIGGVFAAVSLLSFLMLAGCGPDDEEGAENLCAGVSCDFGVCNPDEGICSNKESCTVAGDCLPGYECADDGTCQAINTCQKDGDCDTGVCEEGACVNPETCEDDSDCLPRTYCNTSGEGDATCEPDPCNQKQCVRGVCERGTDTCVSKESCTKSEETFDCVSGEKCADGECAGSETYCDAITCDRGVCSFEAGGCVDADDCSDDSECLEGDFCTDMGQCRPNPCLNINCPRGVCEPNSGQCTQPDSCSTSDDCLADHLCVEGTCKHESAACGNAMGDGGCPGNQICEYDSNNQTASCKEPETCVTSVDCTGDSRCNGQSCVSPQMCSKDRFEGNDSAMNATTFTDAAPSGTLWASACGGNDDFYKVDTTNIVDSSTTGTLVVEVDVPPRDRGLGKLELEVLDGNGNSQGTANTGMAGVDGEARVTKSIMMGDHGTYTIKVSPASNTNKAGVGYELSVDVLPSAVINACKNAQRLTIGQRIAGSTDDGKSGALGSSCTSRDNSALEKIYRVEVDKPQELDFELKSLTNGADFSMSLRRRCTQAASELACANAGGPDADESMTRVVGAGTYYVVVQTPEGATGGSFSLQVDRVLTSCSPDGDYCDKNGDANLCRFGGGRFTTVSCDNGCNVSRGRCVPPEGDICSTAKTIDTMNTQTRTVDLSQTADDYQIGAGGCLGSGDTKTDGPDHTFEVKVPSKKRVRFEATFQNNVDGSLYLVEDCLAAQGTCKAGVKDSTTDLNREVLRYSNTSMSAETLYLVVDTDDNQSVTTADIEVGYKDVICTPSAKFCNMSGDVEQCNQYGTNSSVTEQCALGCSMGACTGESCSDPADVTSRARQMGGTSFSGVSWSNFSDDFNGAPCSNNTGIGGSSAFTCDTCGPDAVLQVDLRQADYLTATISGDGPPSIWVWESGDCGSANSQCLASVESFGSSESIDYLSPSQQTVYLAVDRESGTSGSFTLDVNVEQRACHPSTYSNTCSGSGGVTYCTSQGQTQTGSCGGGSCSGGTCDNDVCSGAVALTTGGTPVTYNPEMGVFTDDYDISGSGGCGDLESNDDSPGPDAVYSVSASAGDIIDATWTHDDSTIYIVDNCGNVAGSCVAADEGFGSGADVQYTATTATTYYVIVDVDEDSATSIGQGTLDIDVR